jgi:hypothetical protein
LTQKRKQKEKNPVSTVLPPQGRVMSPGLEEESAGPLRGRKAGRRKEGKERGKRKRGRR